jgi:hypothetical protein
MGLGGGGWIGGGRCMRRLWREMFMWMMGLMGRRVGVRRRVVLRMARRVLWFMLLKPMVELVGVDLDVQQG